MKESNSNLGVLAVGVIVRWLRVATGDPQPCDSYQAGNDAQNKNFHFTFLCQKSGTDVEWYCPQKESDKPSVWSTKSPRLVYIGRPASTKTERLFGHIAGGECRGRSMFSEASSVITCFSSFSKLWPIFILHDLGRWTYRRQSGLFFS